MAIAVFGFLVGVTAGLLLRRTLPAVAATLAILATVQATVPMAVRQNYATPDRTTVPLVVQSRPGLQLQIVDSRLTVRMPVDLPGAWVTSVNLVDATGTPSTASPRRLAKACWKALTHASPQSTLCICDKLPSTSRGTGSDASKVRRRRCMRC
ncbi:hypothetical protein ACFQ9X_15780 [Catenulispora yoronensis]